MGDVVDLNGAPLTAEQITARAKAAMDAANGGDEAPTIPIPKVVADLTPKLADRAHAEKMEFLSKFGGRAGGFVLRVYHSDGHVFDIANINRPITYNQSLAALLERKKPPFIIVNQSVVNNDGIQRIRRHKIMAEDFDKPLGDMIWENEKAARAGNLHKPSWIWHQGKGAAPSHVDRFFDVGGKAEGLTAAEHGKGTATLFGLVLAGCAAMSLYGGYQSATKVQKTDPDGKKQVRWDQATFAAFSTLLGALFSYEAFNLLTKGHSGFTRL